MFKWISSLFGRRYGTTKLLLAFEYGVVISQVAKERGIEMTRELVEKAEVMIENEARTQTASKMATQMMPNILSIFELDMSK